MRLSPETSSLLIRLRSFSGNRLTREQDLGSLLELGSASDRTAILEDLSFLAKFLSRTHGIMQRIGVKGEGYDALAREFQDSLQRASGLIRQLLEVAPAEVRQKMAATYLGLSHECLGNLLALLYDLSWYKNWLIDHQHR
jgi:hypothetical protein